MINLTDNAANALLELIATKGSGEGLRLAVEKGGCAGMQYVMNLDAQRDDDFVATRLDAKIFVDPDSLQYLKGCTLDYVDSLAGAGFRIHNPRAARSCGCGTSFEHSADDHS